MQEVCDAAVARTHADPSTVACTSGKTCAFQDPMFPAPAVGSKWHRRRKIEVGTCETRAGASRLTGVLGYGTDQSFVRFHRNTGEAAPVVMLGIFAENVVRNVVDYRSFLGQAPHPLWLKGRFRLDTVGALVWSTRPNLDLQDSSRCIASRGSRWRRVF